MSTSAMHLLDRSIYAIRLPDGWHDVPIEPPMSGGRDGAFLVDGHLVRVDRVLTGLIPVTALMGHLSYISRQAFASYETSDSNDAIVPGALYARARITTLEDPGVRDLMAELFAEGMDGNMWYVRVSAARHDFDGRLSDRILDSFQILFTRSSTSQHEGEQ